jgi:putative addiction module killer protein
MMELRHYQTSDGRDHVSEWLDSLDATTRARIIRRLNRFASGLMGDCKSVGDGVTEAREIFGPGYRIYFARIGDQIILLLCCGSKSNQQDDINRAKEFLRDYKLRSKP